MTGTVDRTGRSVDRVEGDQKVTGAARYTADLTLPGQVYAALVQSEIPHGLVTEESMRAGAERASAAPGVLHVLTPLNCPPLGVLPEELTWDLPLERRPPLSDMTVQHVGQHMALVVADTAENAAAAAALFELSYERLPAQLDAREVPPARDGQDGPVRHGSYQPDHFVKLSEEKLQDRRGEPPVDAAHRVAARFTTPLNAHYPIELSATIAAWSGDQLTVHDSTRWIAGERAALAAYLGIPEGRVRVLSPLVGGAFGSKSFLWMHVVLCAVAARETGRPVKLVLTRDQMFSSTGHRPRTEQDLVLLADDDGHILSTEHHTLTETSTVAHFCEPVGLSTRFLYESPHLEVSHRTARLNKPTPCFMRGPGEAPGLFALEVAIDELAHQTGLDPLALRLRNHADIDQASGKPWSGKHLLECYHTGAQRFGWQDRPLAPRALRRDGVQVGWGMATATYPGRRMPAGCRVVTAPDGTVRFASATHEIGNGVRTVMTQVAADVTGLPLSRVTFESGDSDFPAAPYSGASQTTATVGSAVHAAATEWKRRLLSLAGDNAQGVDLAALAGTHHDQLTFTARSDAGDQSGQASQSFGAHFCEVEVDEQIGRVSVTRWVAVMDCGRVLNPKLARSQVMGGITFGLGMALLEQVPYDADTAQMIGEYYLPTHADRPEFDVTFVESDDFGLDPIGVRGIGEIGTCGVPAAIANAIFHATGKRLRELPITLEDLMVPYHPPVAEEVG
ncbi:xanthine dehydrogenase family protein molybdopterin-binding subunit [Mycolicibacterium litorale]|uniref:Acylaldehyde oxidase n=1 Tax=Mycolicibacterium litorale TaxID=758802 RepID=A0AAD1IJX4_9MYCO|nr:xanthine dehydrogenase family protein molybdopterin-binding subunit [Mycolicibacterium litorale]MCV7415898.1 xanthine dehydrogenase family protein molybdopterin-binding subunit [Mycolicibacterium litorale]TDY09150.1 xanthine dehydrogenase YagR molybdenum-binding subunit [Mycolicibacterium litorale]BBY17087.1 acylaldehyde oxidase [Mycolicibacterium litorale]